MTDTSTKTAKARPVSFSPEELQAVIAKATAEAVAQATSALRAEMQTALAAKPSATINGKSDVSAKNDLAVLRTFKRQGFTDIQPRKNVLTFNRWRDLGRRPVEGSKSLKVNGLRLFHITQTRELTKAELAAPKDQPKAAAKPSKGTKVVPINGQAEMPL